MLDQLQNFKRETPLSEAELIKLYQLNLFIKDSIKQSKLEAQFAKIIPADVIQAATRVVKRWDQRVFSFPEAQKEIATKLLKLRVTFSENVAASKDGAYSANFKFRLPGEKIDTLLVLSDSSMKNTSNEDWLKVP